MLEPEALLSAHRAWELALGKLKLLQGMVLPGPDKKLCPVPAWCPEVSASPDSCRGEEPEVSRSALTTGDWLSLEGPTQFRIHFLNLASLAKQCFITLI